MMKLTICAFLLLIAAVSLVDMHAAARLQGTMLHRGHHESISRKDVSNVDPAGHVLKKFKRSDHSAHHATDAHKTAKQHKTTHTPKSQKMARKQPNKPTKKAKEAQHKHARKAKNINRKH